MKRLIIGMLSAFFFAASPLFAQVPDILKDDGWIIGINGGLSYQTSDVRSRLNGFGLGADLGRHLFYKPGAAVALDWRGRLTYAQQYGLDHTRTFAIDRNDALNGTRDLNYLLYPDGSKGYVFQNYKTDLIELSLEGAVTANRLRERTRFIVSVFGGIGVGFYQTYINQLDANNQPYFQGYAGIDPDGSRAAIKRDLGEILDDSYETLADDYGDGVGKTSFMPSFGLELGYQVTPAFSVYLGQRATFSGTDLLDGQQWATVNRDVYHYSSIGARWYLNKPKVPVVDPPVIRFTNPAYSPFRSILAEGVTEARIDNVEKASDVYCRFNGEAIPFDYYNGVLTARYTARPGKNEIEINAVNEGGTAREKVVIEYIEEEGPELTYPPKVVITNPSYEGLTVKTRQFVVTARIEAIDFKEDIEFYLNGNRRREFTYNSASGNFQAPVDLLSGQNTIEIKVLNRSGKDEAKTVVVLDEPSIAPTVDITRPATSNLETETAEVSLEAQISQIRGKNQLTLRLNGRSLSGFSYDGTSGRLRADIPLEAGNNIVVVEAKNEAGTASDQVNIFYKRPPKPPKITRVVPVLATTTTSDESARVELLISNVERSSDLQVTLNGRTYTGFTFTPVLGKFSATVPLASGYNELYVRATNTDGQAETRINWQRNAGNSGGGGGVIQGNNMPLAPSIQIQSPANGQRLNTPTTTLKASVLNLVGTEGISIQMNGRALNLRDLRFNALDGTISLPVALTPGENTLRLIGKNEGGSREETVTVYYQPQVVKPVIQITSPEANKTVTEQSIKVTADVSNTERVEVRLNGQLVGSPKPINNKVEVTIPLREGTNTVGMKAINQGEQAADQVVVTYRPRKAPIITITEPQKPDTETIKPDFTLQAIVQNIGDRSNLRMTQNGKPIPSFNLNGSQLIVPLRLEEGINTLVIEAVTLDGKDVKETKILYTRPQKPDLIILEPTGSMLSQPSTTIKALVKHVDSKRNILCKVNGRPTAAFTLEGENLTIPLENLADGKNEIVIVANNGFGQATAELTLSYQPQLPLPIINNLVHSPLVVNPQRLGFASTTVSAVILNITGKEQLTVTVNGKPSSDYLFVENTFSLSLLLEKGKTTTVVLKAVNEGGDVERTIEMSY